MMIKQMTKIIGWLILIQFTFAQNETITGRVTYFTTNQVYCDLGKNNHVSVGDTLDISRRSHLIGTIIVSHLSSKTSVSDIFIQHSEIKLGDLVIPRKPLSSTVTSNSDSDSLLVEPKPKRQLQSKEPIFSHRGTFSFRYNFNQISNQHRLRETLQYAAQYKKIKMTVYGRSNSSSGQFNLYQAKGDWGTPSDKYYLQVGRVFSPKLSGIGATDGLLGQYNFTPKLTLGGLIGAQPDIDQIIPTFDITKIGVYSSFKKSTATLNWTGTISFVGQYTADMVDREFSYLKFQGNHKSRLSFQLMSVLDYYRTSLGNRTGLEYTSLQANLRYRLKPYLTISSRLSDRVRPYYRTQYDSKQDSIISNEAISGWMNSIHLKFKKIGSIQVGGNIRKQSSKDLAYLFQFHYRSIPLFSLESIGIESNWIQNRLIRGLQSSLNVEKRFSSNIHFYGESEFYFYGYGLTPFDYLQKSVTLSMNKKFSHLYTFVNTDIIFNETNESSLYFYTGLSYRF